MLHTSLANVQAVYVTQSSRALNNEILVSILGLDVKLNNEIFVGILALDAILNSE